VQNYFHYLMKYNNRFALHPSNVIHFTAVILTKVTVYVNDRWFNINRKKV